MNKRFTVIASGFIAIVINCPSAISESNREVPSRKEWNMTCMSNALEQDGEDTLFGKHWGSSVDKAFAQSFCTCRHEQVKHQKYINYNEFTEAWQECQKEFTSDNTNSVTKYLQIHLDNRRINQYLQSSPERPRHP